MNKLGCGTSLRKPTHRTISLVGYVVGRLIAAKAAHAKFAGGVSPRCNMYGFN